MIFPKLKVMTVMLQYDYGKKERGFSSEKKWFFENLLNLVGEVRPVWYDEFVNNPEPLQHVILREADEFKPDLVFFLPYTNQFQVETLKTLKGKFQTAVWFGDDHWRFESHSKELAPNFTTVITTDPLRVPDYKEIGVEPILSDWAGQPTLSTLKPSRETQYRYDVSFIGGRNQVRTWFVNKLKARGIKVECFGAGWPNGRISFKEMDEIFFQSRINLNLSNSVPQDISFVFGHPMNFVRWLVSKKQTEQVKARNFEIPLAGGFQLSKYAVGLERHWQIGKEIAIFNSPDECADQIRYYLANEAERFEMSLRAFERANLEHTFEQRLTKILKQITTHRAV